MYQALYRKYRPRTFDDVVGQDAITQTLKTQLRTGKLSHAYLFTGTRGTGKTSCAKILAKAVNCPNLQDGNPCNCCAACKSIDSGSCMDVLEIDAASNNGVDQVRALRDDAIYTPSEVRKRVYIIDEVHMLSLAAFNALLKIIEEPPEHLIFILATTELHKVPATILSRCQRFSFRRLLQEDIAARLNFIAYQEHIDLEPEACRLLARLADGAMRDGASLLDQCASAAGGTVTTELIYSTLGLAGEKRTAQLMQAVANHDSATALELFSGLYASGKDIAAMLDELTALSRDLLILKTAPKSGMTMLSGVVTEQEAAGLYSQFTPAELLRLTTVLQETVSGFAKSANRRVDAELCILRLCDPGLDLDATSINARLSRLEDKIASGAFATAPACVPASEEDGHPLPNDEETPPPDFEDLPPVPRQSRVESSPTGFWPDFAAKLKSRVPMKLTGFVPGTLHHLLEDNLLTLVAESSFVQEMLNIPEVLDPAAEIASAMLGRPMRVRCLEKSKLKAAQGGKDLLSDLVRFGQEHETIISIKD